MKSAWERRMESSLASMGLSPAERVEVEWQLERMRAKRESMKGGCALCGKKTENLVLTDCCERWMCDES